MPSPPLPILGGVQDPGLCPPGALGSGACAAGIVLPGPQLRKQQGTDPSTRSPCLTPGFSLRPRWGHAPALYRDQPMVCGVVRPPAPGGISSISDSGRETGGSTAPPAPFCLGRIRCIFFKVPASPGLGFPVLEAFAEGLSPASCWAPPQLDSFLFFPPSYLVRSENPSLCSVLSVLSLNLRSNS